MRLSIHRQTYVRPNETNEDEKDRYLSTRLISNMILSSQFVADKSERSVIASDYACGVGPLALCLAAWGMLTELFLLYLAESQALS